MFHRSFDVANFRVHCCFHTGPEFPVVLLLICIGQLQIATHVWGVKRFFNLKLSIRAAIYHLPYFCTLRLNHFSSH